MAWLDGRPVGCGGWRTFAGHAAEAAGDAAEAAGDAASGIDGAVSGTDGAAEIKRMFTAPEARGRGVALALLRALEESARRAGRKRIILETGYMQPEAIALYVKAGYERIPDFGHYRHEPGVYSFGKDL